MSNRRHMVRGHHRAAARVRPHLSYEAANPLYEDYNPLGAAAKIALAVVGLAALGGVVYYATRPSAASAAAAAGGALTLPAGGMTQGSGYQISVVSATDPSQALQTAGFQSNNAQTLVGSGTFIQGTGNTWTGNVTWNGATTTAATLSVPGITSGTVS